MSLFKQSALEIRDSFVEGKVTASQIADHFLKRIKNFDPQIKSFIKILEDTVRKKAEELDLKRSQNKRLGKLAGVPIAIKDNMHIKGEITTCGSKFLQNYVAPFDATAVRLFEAEDALLIGKTNLDEFAMGSSNENSAFFKTNNPWSLDCSPGGSSGGSAAAVAARLALIATGSDTGGSIRQPAALCGVVGFKPTYGRVSRYGLVAFGSSLDQIGPLTTTVADIGLIMEVIGKHCKMDSTSSNFPQELYLDHLNSSSSSMEKIKIGIPWNFLKDLKKEAHENFKNSVKLLKDLGAEIVDINLDILDYSIPVYYILSTAEASTNLARFDGIKYGVRSESAKTLDEVYDRSRDEGFGKEVKKRIMLGTFVLSAGYQDAFYRKAQRVRTLIINAFDKAFEDCDLVVMPVSPNVAFKSGSIQDPIQMYLQDIFTVSANLAGLPSISLPSGFNSDNKPFGLQILGPQLHDVSVVKYAHIFEKAAKDYQKIPPLFDKEFDKDF